MVTGLRIGYLAGLGTRSVFYSPGRTARAHRTPAQKRAGFPGTNIEKGSRVLCWQLVAGRQQVARVFTADHSVLQFLEVRRVSGATSRSKMLNLRSH